MNKKYLILALTLFIVIAVIIMFVALVGNNKQGTKEAPSPTPNLINQPGAVGGSVPAQTQQEKEQLRKSGLVSELIGKLPYSGTNFSLYYSYSINQFTLYINPTNQAAGNMEFDSFLKSNGIENRSWLPNLLTTDKNVNPAP